jgi:hypothetical protein
MTGEALWAYVKQFAALAPSKCNVVVLDNLGTCEIAGIPEAVKAVGASILYLPHSPGLNSTGQVLAKLKPLIRKAATQA